MTAMFVQPEFVASAATDVSNIGSVIDAARAAAAGPTTSVVAAAEDEVSAIAAAFMGSYGQELQALLMRAGTFHDQFAAALAGAQVAYVEAETAAVSLLGGNTAASALAAAGDPPLPTLNTPITGLFIGGSGLPVPPPSYLSAVLPWVNFNGTNIVSLANALPVFTPEGAQPIYSGIKSLPLNTSVGQGVMILQNTINQQLFPGGIVTPSPSVSVLGYSQSAVISSLVMRNLLNGTYPFTPPSTSQLNFTLLGNLMNPNGGIFERFVGLSLPSLGVDFYGATPPDTPYGTSIYTLQYDGFADFPQYPINFLADLNAFAGIYYVHGTYPSINPSALPPGDELILLPGSAALGGAPATNYYMITQPNLPLLNPVRAIPVIGNPIADLLQPDLTHLVNWGYGDPNFGYSTGPANVPTPFGVLPPLSDTLALPGALATGTQQGITAFMNDVNTEAPILANSFSLASLTSLGSATATGGSSLLPAMLASAQSLTPTGIIESLQTAITNGANFISNAAAQSYAVLLPTADILNASVISVPAYDVNLFITGIEQALNGDPTGGLIYAFGAPLAADTALYTLLAGFELEVIANAATAIIAG